MVGRATGRFGSERFLCLFALGWRPPAESSRCPLECIVDATTGWNYVIPASRRDGPRAADSSGSTIERPRVIAACRRDGASGRGIFRKHY
jgi:hypothetical protein